MAPVTRSALHRSADEKSSSTRRGKKVLPVAQPSNNGRGRKHSVATKSSSVGKGKRCYSVDMEMDKCWWLERSPVWKKFKTTVKEIQKSDKDMYTTFLKMYVQFHYYNEWTNDDSFVKAVSEHFPQYPQFVEALSELLKAYPN
ncbi:unnamed protein product [Cuscuta epithymum]|uniref:Uncharacterized protein n=1 Tax=Cuscuta epithymum TaxID=186058 RepID=A0AAV0G6R1_9ASTE|nr:unnamed protein product [Cuscuta epithymum]CAH9142938.1 unnamed protein product [Cuscuta epithymum]